MDFSELDTLQKVRLEVTKQIISSNFLNPHDDYRTMIFWVEKIADCILNHKPVLSADAPKEQLSST